MRVIKIFWVSLTLVPLASLPAPRASSQEVTRVPVSQASIQVPLDSWVYRGLDRLAALGYVHSAFVGLRPWTRAECQRLLQEATAEIALDGRTPQEVLKLLAALSDEFREERSATSPIKVDSLYFRWLEIAGRPLRDGYHLAETITNDYGRPFAEGANLVVGMSISGTPGRFSWAVRGEWQRWPSPRPLSPNTRQASASADNRPVLPDSGSGAQRFRLLDTMVGLQWRGVQVSFGKQSLWSGPGQGGPWMFSNNAEPIWMAQVTSTSPMRIPAVARALGAARWQFFLGRLAGHQFVFSAPTLYGPELSSPPFIHGAKISFHPTGHLELGMGLTTVFGGPGMPFTVGNFVRTFNFWARPNAFNDKGDHRSGFDFSYRVPRLRRFLTLYGDSMVEDEVSPIGSSRPAVRTGVYLPRLPHLSKMELRMEGLYSDVPGHRAKATIYYNHRYRSGYTNYGQLLGNWIGRQGRGGQAWLGYWFLPRGRVQFSYRHMEVDRSLLQGGRLHDLGTQCEFRMRRSLVVSTLMQYERWNFPLLSPRRQNNLSIGFRIDVLPGR